MTVPSEIARNDYIGNGVTVAFPYTFRLIDATHVRVILSTDGVESELVLNTDFTVSGVGSPSGGTVTTTTAPASDVAVAILRQVPGTQLTDLRNQSSYYPEDIENAFDLAAMRHLQQQDAIDRSLHLPESEAGSDLLTLLPALADRKGKQLTFDPTTGQPVASNPSATAVSTAMQPVVASATTMLAAYLFGLNGYNTVNVRHYGAVGDGTTNDDVALAAAFAAGQGKTIFFPPGVYRITKSLFIGADNTKILGYGAEIYWTIAITGATAYLTFAGVTNAAIVVQKPTYDKVDPLPASGLVVYSANTLKGFGCYGLSFRSYGFLGGPNSAYENEAIAMDGVENWEVYDCTFQNIRNECLFGGVWLRGRISRCRFIDCAHDGIAPVVARDCLIDHNEFHNVLNGFESSLQHTVISDNIFTASDGAPVANAIWCGTSSRGALIDGAIKNNHFYGNFSAIILTNETSIPGSPDPIQRVEIDGNTIFQPAVAKGIFEHAITIQTSTTSQIYIRNNNIESLVTGVPTGVINVIMTGAGNRLSVIGNTFKYAGLGRVVSANAGASGASYVFADNDIILPSDFANLEAYDYDCFGWLRLPSSAVSNTVEFAGNRFNGTSCLTTSRTGAYAGSALPAVYPALDLSGSPDISYILGAETVSIRCPSGTILLRQSANILNRDGANLTLTAGQIAVYKRIAPGVYRQVDAVDRLTGSATYDPPSLADGAGTTTTVACNGAVLGDLARASFSLDLQGITVTAWVSASGVVSVRFQNESGGVLDLASGTLRVRVEKA